MPVKTKEKPADAALGGTFKVTVPAEKLRWALGLTSRVTPKRTTLPILTNVLMTVDNGRLKFTSTDLEVLINVWVDATTIEGTGAAAVPASLFTEWARSIGDGDVELSIPGKPVGKLEAKAGRSKGQFYGSDPEEYPPPPTLTDSRVVTISAESLRFAISRVAFVAARDETRPILTGVKFETHGDKFIFAAADGYRLAVQSAPLAVPVEDPGVALVIPAETLKEVGRSLTDGKGEVKMEVGKERVRFTSGDIQLTSSLVAGTFPRWDQLIPTNGKTRVKLPLEDLARTVGTAMVFARNGSMIVRLDIEKSGAVHLKSRSDELGDYQGEVTGEVTGEDNKIAFNCRYMSELMDAVGSSSTHLTLEMTGPSGPALFRGGSDDYSHVLMPMFVDN